MERTHDEELIDQLAASAVLLERGCDCEYDYRCNRCDRILRTKELAEQYIGERSQRRSR